MLPLLLALIGAACGDGGGTTGDACPGGTCRDAAGDGAAEGRDGPAADPAAERDAPPGDGGDEICADVSVSLTPKVPTVILLVDRSGSMDERFGSGTRWDVLRASLLASPGGLLDELDAAVRFGLTLYTSDSGAPPCPTLASVAPKMSNFPDIRDMYEDAEPLGDTPTGQSIDEVADALVAGGWEGTLAIILATDGEPDTCENPSPRGDTEQAQTRQVAVDAAVRAFGMGITTYVISVGTGIALAHLQDMANAGAGRGPGDPDAPYWVAGDDAALREALRSTITSTLPCEFELNGRLVLAEACSGTVTLNGRELACDDPDGWRAKDETHIELLGAACEEATSGDAVTLTASFPCGAVVPI